MTEIPGLRAILKSPLWRTFFTLAVHISAVGTENSRGSPRARTPVFCTSPVSPHSGPCCKSVGPARDQSAVARTNRGQHSAVNALKMVIVNKGYQDAQLVRFQPLRTCLCRGVIRTTQALIKRGRAIVPSLGHIKRHVTIGKKFIQRRLRRGTAGLEVRVRSGDNYWTQRIRRFLSSSAYASYSLTP